MRRAKFEKGSHKYDLPDYDFWTMAFFDIEWYLKGYTKDRIISELDADEIVQKWIMIKNKEHIERESEMYSRFMLHPNNDGKQKFKFTEVPFPKTVKEPDRAFDREKAWEEAPEYDLDRMATLF